MNKEQYVLSKTTVPDKPNTRKGMYRKVLKANGKRMELHASSYEGLIDKLYDFYMSTVSPFTDCTFQGIYNASVEAKREETTRSENTFIRNQRAYNQFINSELGNMDISDITPQYLKRYSKNLLEDYLQENNKRLSEKDWKRYKGILNTAFDYAVELQIIQYNPAKFVKQDNFRRLIDSRKPTAIEKIYTDKQLDLIETEIRRRMNLSRYSPVYIDGYAMLVSKYTGLRAGELPAVKWNDINFKDRSIHIHSSQIIRENVYGDDRYEFVPWTKDEKGKAKDDRYVPICDELMDILKELKREYEKNNIVSEYVFPNLKKDNYMHNYQNLCKKLNLKLTNNHALRMSFNSLVLIPSGFTPTERASILGQSELVNINNYSFDKLNSTREKAIRMCSYGHN